MDILLITVGKTTTGYIQTGIDEYCRRLKRYVPFSIKCLPDSKNARKLTESQQKTEEGKLILGELSSSDHVVLLDERGDMLTSRGFSEFLQKGMLGGKKRMVFVVGGPYGFSNDVYDRANSKLSFSKMTFSHEMIRLFFTEQVYRAMTILRGEPYHHD
ncbi:MAG: 23S rRNA (pseudouridine(1915)-N(3))-methyltransferase RlmH [Muribaculaceae bacterium]|nr:23S rRNA (pseudouridine(1915)-N(3))-methyltransferase RlmH [Muribaculaceae bacterium]